MKDLDLTNLNIEDLSNLLDKKEVTSEELVGAYLENIKKKDPKLNTFMKGAHKEAERIAVLNAKEADKRIKAGKRLSKLDGIPFSAKDVLLTKGVKTTAASKMLEDYVPLENAASVQKLVEAGAIVIGKNNCDAWAHGSSTENSDFGPTKNPWDTERVPGGSSGGSAAAVAASMAPFSIGTDTGGSIRQPASFCGVVGLKPTYGLVSRYGLIAMASSLDVVGPITKTVYDNALVLSAIAGKDKKDATSAGSQPKDYLKDIKKGVKKIRIGVPEEYYKPGFTNYHYDALDVFKKLGAEIIEISLPNTKYGIAAYYIIQPAEVSSNLGRYDGVKYGFSAKESKNLIDHYFASRTEGFGDEAKRRIMLGTYVLSAGYYDAYYKKAMQVRAMIKKDFDDAFKKCDIILAPTAPTPAFKFGTHNNPVDMYLQDVYTVNANLAGIPALSVPCGFVKPDDGEELLPIGMQLIGPNFSEDVLFRAAYAYEEATRDAEWRGNKPEV